MVWMERFKSLFFTSFKRSARIIGAGKKNSRFIREMEKVLTKSILKSGFIKKFFKMLKTNPFAYPQFQDKL